MKQLPLLFIIVFFLNCKKDVESITPNSKSVLEVFYNKKIAIDSTLISKFKNKDLMAFYKSNSFETVWESPENRKEVLKELNNAETEGLDPKDYAVEKLADYEKKHEKLTDNELVDYDILLTHNLQKYLTQSYKGKLNPKDLYKDWDLRDKKFDVNVLLFDAFKKNSFAEAIEKSKPSQSVYKELKSALKIIDNLPQDYFIPIAFSSKAKIKPGEINALLVPIKKRLMFWGDLKPSDTITKKYSLKTVDAVKKFQKRHGLEPDGVIGSGTINALNFYKNERREQIIANMERWRWFPTDFGKHYSLVNIPNFKINVIKEGDTLITQKVIIGTEKRRSPVFSTKLNQVVFNPTWTVPPTIIKEDLIPDATKSRSYFNKMHIVIYDSKKNKISPWSWKAENANRYTYVQDPGNHNSLGNMKIIFPNKFSVYLHDTNHKDGFSRNFRSLSSGCTRLEKPLELAKYVLNDSIHYNLEKIDSIIKTKKTKNILIKQEILHYQLYWTAWMENNHLVFRNDIYNLDFDLYCKLRH